VGANPHTIRSTALALCYSAAEYACPVWERSTHAYKIDQALNTAYRCITGCLKLTKVDNLYVFSAIAPPGLRRRIASGAERSRETTDPRHPLHGARPPRSRLKSRRGFLMSVEPLSESAGSTHIKLWKRKFGDAQPYEIVREIKEELTTGGDEDWVRWRCLNRLKSRSLHDKGNDEAMGLR